MTQSLTMKPLLISKINTAAQIALAVVMLGKLGLDVSDEYGVMNAMTILVATTTILSGAAYIAIWGWRIFRIEDTK
jgi:cardiolipin synthase